MIMPRIVFGIWMTLNCLLVIEGLSRRRAGAATAGRPYKVFLASAGATLYSSLITHPSSLLFVHFSRLHYEAHVFHLGIVANRLTLHSNEVGIPARLNRSDFLRGAEHSSGARSR